MIKWMLIIQCIFFTTISFAQHTIHIKIDSLPAYHPADADIYAAGTFNNWNPKDENYKFKPDKNGKYSLEIKLNAGRGEYKLTRGSWDKVECADDGSLIRNRGFKISGDVIFEVTVKGWADHFPSKPKQSTASKNVKIIDTAFYIPQLQRTRRIWIYLPAGYETTRKKYPVLYMHDGQNVFDDATSYAGEWGVDECLDSMGEKMRSSIVIAIDNGQDKRLNEYSPYDFSLTGIAATSKSNKGEGKEYVDFLVKTLKRYVDRHYRTLRKRKNTFIAGSSMGGLISMYALLRYPKVYGGAGVFSPAFWMGPGIFRDIDRRGRKIKSKIFFYAGKKEGESMVPHTIEAFDRLHRVSKSEIEMVIRDEGIHNESRWRMEFPIFYEWLMKENR